jgi:nitroreductase
MKEIYTRRSIRKYKDIPLEESQIRQVIRAGTYAPSAGNEKPWHFIVITKRETLEAITSFHPYTQMLKSAPVAIIACADLTNIKYEGVFWIQDMSAAVQNMLLEATSMNLGSCWCGVYPNPVLVDNLSMLLDLPSNIIPAAIVALGVADEAREIDERFNESLVHYEKW